MIGLFLIYSIGKYFADLAYDHDRKRWVFAILGVATYYAGTFIFGFLLGFILALTGNGYLLDEISDFVLSLILLPFGILSTWILYISLKKNWIKNPKSANDELLDSLQTDNLENKF